MAEGSVVCACFLVYVACLDDSWQILIGDAYRRVGLAVFEQDVVERLMFLDEIVFLYERIFIGRYNNILDVFNLAYQNLSLSIFG